MTIEQCDCTHCCPHGANKVPFDIESVCECEVSETDMPCEGDWEKLNDKAVFCRKCGSINTVEPESCPKTHYPCQLPHYPMPCPKPHYPCTRPHYDFFTTVSTSPNTTTF